MGVNSLRAKLSSRGSVTETHGSDLDWDNGRVCVQFDEPKLRPSAKAPLPHQESPCTRFDRGDRFSNRVPVSKSSGLALDCVIYLLSSFGHVTSRVHEFTSQLTPTLTSETSAFMWMNARLLSLSHAGDPPAWIRDHLSC
jgi:hypothetical protein